MALLNRASCLARIEPGAVDVLTAALLEVSRPLPVIVHTLSVTEMGLLAPGLLVVDLDGLDVDPLEMLRRLRFVLPACMIAVYTSLIDEDWAMSCHLAGANCLLSKASDEGRIGVGLRDALRGGCFTDPAFRAA